MENEIKVGFEIQLNSTGSIKKACMKKLAKLFFELSNTSWHDTYFVKDTTEKSFCFDVYCDVDCSYCDFTVSCTLFNSELPVDLQGKYEEVNTCFSCSVDDENNTLDFDDSCYEVSKERI